MGLEATCICCVDGESAEAKVLLESRELILRAPLRRRFAIAGMADIRVEGDSLLFTAEGSAVGLKLGDAAPRWAKKILTPPPSLAGKLGIGAGRPAHVIGAVDDAALAEALDGHVAGPGLARLSVAVVRDGAELDDALEAHRALPPGSPIWVVHGKGAGASFGDNAVRAHMRALGYRDSKSSAVSERLSATRYALG